MTITDIDILRDGGTILFRISGATPLSGGYRLRTPFAGEPRPIFRDETQLELGSAAEADLSGALQHWLDAQLSPAASAALGELDQLEEWRNLPRQLVDVVPLHRIRAVIRCIEARRGA